MAYTKLIPIRSWVALKKALHYVQDPQHKNHLEYHLEEFSTGRTGLTSANYVPQLKAAFTKLRQNQRCGHPVTVLGYLHIVRTPYPPDWEPETIEKYELHDAEKTEFRVSYATAIAPDGLALSGWHHNKLFGCGDLASFVPNLTDLECPQVRRLSTLDPIKQARDVADLLTENLNQKRREQGRPPLQTMPERQRELARKRRGVSLERHLADYPHPVRLKNLKAVLKELGYEVVRFSPDSDYLSIRFQTTKETKPKQRKKKKTNKSKAKKEESQKVKTVGVRFGLMKLLNDVYLLRQERVSAPQISTEQTRLEDQAAAFQLPKDQELDRIISETVKEHNLGSPDQSQHAPKTPTQSTIR